jgi:hypothetical protein
MSNMNIFFLLCRLIDVIHQHRLDRHNSAGKHMSVLSSIDEFYQVFVSLDEKILF